MKLLKVIFILSFIFMGLSSPEKIFAQEAGFNKDELKKVAEASDMSIEEVEIELMKQRAESLKTKESLPEIIK